MYEKRLLERISYLERSGNETDLDEFSQAILSVMNHLQRMLNTRKGSALIDEEYGIPDITNFPGEQLIKTGAGMASLIQKFIQRYEPRLTEVKVSFESQKDDPLSLRFRLQARLLSFKKTPITFETWIDPNGKVNIATEESK